MSSRAFADLTARLQEVRTLAGLDPARAGDASQTAVSNAVNRACIVLLSAHLEGFLEDLLLEALDVVVARGTPVDRLPLILRALHAETHLSQLAPMRDRNARAPRIEKMFLEEAALWSAGQAVQATMIRQGTVRAEMANPGSKEIRQFMELVGVDIRAYINNVVGASHLLGRVDGLIGLRNQVAHGEINVRATFQDVDTYTQIVQDLCRHADDAVAAGIQGMCSLAALPW